MLAPVTPREARLSTTESLAHADPVEDAFTRLIGDLAAAAGQALVSGSDDYDRILTHAVAAKTQRARWLAGEAAHGRKGRAA
jgi:hypothetical protein